MVLKYSKKFVNWGAVSNIFQTFVIFFIIQNMQIALLYDSNIICSSSDFIEIKDISRYE